MNNSIRTTENKVRRNSEEVDRDIMLATKELVEEIGFNKLTLAKIGDKAHLAPNMFYKRYPDLEKLIEKFIRKYDYWFNDIVEISFDKSSLGEYYETVMLNLAESLYENKAMQQILIYELSNDNSITRRTARLRELDSNENLREYDPLFENTDVDIRTHTALIIAGIYYLILHRDRSEFCGIDLNTDEGRRRLHKTISYTCNMLFDKVENKYNVSHVAKNMKNENIDISVISKCTGLSKKEIEAL